MHGSPWLRDCPGIGTIKASVMREPQDLGGLARGLPLLEACSRLSGTMPPIPPSCCCQLPGLLSLPSAALSPPITLMAAPCIPLHYVDFALQRFLTDSRRSPHKEFQCLPLSSRSPHFHLCAASPLPPSTRATPSGPGNTTLESSAEDGSVLSPQGKSYSTSS